jgi:hypothetical protein
VYLKIPGGKAWPASKAGKLTAHYEPTIYTMWESRHLTTLYASKTCYRDGFAFFPIVFAVCNLSFIVCVALCAVLFERGVISFVICVFVCCVLF